MTLYMPLFRCSTTLRTLTQLHAHLFVTGLQADPLASTKLIESYAEVGSLPSSRLVFETFRNPDSFMWGVLVKSYVWNQCFEEAVSLFHKMVYQEIQFNEFVFPSILRACSGFGDMTIGEKVHGRIVKCGYDGDAVVETSLLSMYGEAGCLDGARKVFDEMPVRDLVSWSSIITCDVENGEALEGLDVFRRMVSEGVEADSVTMLSVVEACGEMRSLSLAKSVHGYVIRKEIQDDGSLNSSLIVMYTKCDDLRSSELTFAKISQPDTSSWTAMISSYNQAGFFHEALGVFADMQKSEVEVNSVTLFAVLSSCSRLGLFKQGRSVHSFIIRNAIDPPLDFMGPALIELYANSLKLSVCNRILHVIGDRSILPWNMLISAYAQNQLLAEALAVFVKLYAEGLRPDSFSLASSISASGDLDLFHFGQQIHSHTIKSGYFSNDYVRNSLIDMYSNCRFVDLAYKIFNEIKWRSVVTWNSMMCGFSQNGYSIEAIKLFDEMYSNCQEMGEITFLSAIKACSLLGHLEKGKWIHHKLITHGLIKHQYIETALTDMYGKCGDLDTSQRVFDHMSEKSLVSWSTMIASYGAHGQINTVIELYNQMLDSGLKPNEVTFMNILSACSHAGLVKEGKFYFSSMTEYGIEQKTEHFSCMVDILSRAGELDEAYKIIKSMPFSVDSSIWGALLNGCRIHLKLDMVKTIQRDLLNLRTDDTGYYTLLSNVYAEEGEWNEFHKVRRTMKSTGLKKVPAFSSIEIDRRVHRFGAGDTFHLESNEIFRLLDNFQSLAIDDGNCVHYLNSVSDISIYSEYGLVSYSCIYLKPHKKKVMQQEFSQMMKPDQE